MNHIYIAPVLKTEFKVLWPSSKASLQFFLNAPLHSIENPPAHPHSGHMVDGDPFKT